MRRAYIKIDPEAYGMVLSEEDFGYTWSNFEELPAFFSRAARAKRAVVFTADQ